MTTLIERKRKRPKIDVVPLIDVLMVLIIFFLVTMQFQDLRAINVKLPKIDIPIVKNSSAQKRPFLNPLI